MGQQKSGASVPATVMSVAVLLGLQALALVIAVVRVILDFGAEDALPLSAQLFLVFLLVLGVLWLSVTAFSVTRGRAWTRAAIVVTQLFAVILSFNYFSTGDAGIGIPLLISGALTLVLSFMPTANEFIARRGE